MKRPKVQKRRSNASSLGLLLIGAGLVVIALVSGYMLLDWTTSASSSSTNLVVPAEVSFPAPELTLTDLNGNSVALRDYLGTVVLVNNWATWCPPCRAEMPVLAAYYQDHMVDGFSIIAVDAGESETEVRKFVENNQLNFPVWLDPQMDAIRAFRNNGLPSSYIVNRAGEVVLAWNGSISQEMLEKYVTPLLEN